MKNALNAAIATMRPGFVGGWVSANACSVVIQQKRIRCIRRGLVGQILTEMNYVIWGRAKKYIKEENDLRPTLWCHPDMLNRSFEDFLKAQGYEKPR